MYLLPCLSFSDSLPNELTYYKNGHCLLYWPHNVMLSALFHRLLTSFRENDRPNNVKYLKNKKQIEK